MRSAKHVAGCQIETSGPVVGSQRKIAKPITAVLLRADNRIVAAAVIKGHHQARQVGKQFAPRNIEALAVSFGRVVGQPRQVERALAVPCPVIRDRARKMAAAKDARRKIETTAVEEGTELGILPGLTEVGGQVERQKIRIVIRAR